MASFFDILFIGGILVGILGFGLWLFALIDVLRSRFRNDADKIIWVLVVLFLQFLGAIIYFAVGRNQKIA
ncbi:MAG: PLD nuclease N-terminal domain-containing protein [Bacteroidota bacterium]